MGFEFDQPAAPSTNRQVNTQCETCDGDRFVLVATRPPLETQWMAVHKIAPNKDVPGNEEYAPCPSCNAGADTTFFRPDGSPFRSPDPAATLRMMRS